MSVEDLAAQILEDIAARGLGPGDRYLTAAEAQRRFGVHRAAIDATFRSLSERNILVRRQRAGTFVGPGTMCADSSEPQRFDKILVLYELIPPYLTADELMRVMWRRFPGVAVQFVLLRSRNEARYVRHLIDQATAVREKVGLIPVSCSRNVYELLASTRLPTVVLGSIDHQHEDHLTSVDGDAARAGRLLVEYLLARGRSRIAVIMGETWRIGDNRFYEGIRLGMSEAGLPADGLRVVSLPPHRNSIKKYVSSCLAEADGPTAFISRPGRVGPDLWVPQVIADAVAEAGLQVPRDISVVYHLDRDRSSGQFPVFPCTYRTWTWVQTFDRVADLLAAAMHDGPDAPREHVLLPVAMYEPTSA